MELIPKEIRDEIPPLYATEDQLEPVAYVKLFIVNTNWTWLITELSIDEDICFGYVISPFCDGELGYFSLEELRTIGKGGLGLEVERDEQFKPTKLSEIKETS